MKDLSLYLDYAAATPLDERVFEVMKPFMLEDFYNPSSPYAPAIETRQAYEAAKDDVARSIGGRGSEIVITAGATESINLAFGWVSGHVVTSSIEHHAVLAAASQRDHTLVEPSGSGRIQADAIKKAIRPDTELVSIAIANNEIGTIQPLRDIASVIDSERRARLARGDKRPIFLHSDASQGLGLLDINTARLGVDMLTINAGKVYGPKQVGALWADSRVGLKPQIVGGGQERGLRSGTENVAGVIGFAEALRLANKRRKSESERLRKLRDFMQTELVTAFPGAVVSGHAKHRLPNILHISFPNIDAERVLFALESKGVLLATGSACAANKSTRSHVLSVIGLAPEVADGSLRISLGKFSTEEGCRLAVEVMRGIIEAEYIRMGIGL